MTNADEKRRNTAESWLDIQPRMSGGVTIYFSPACDLSDRLALSNGTRVASARETTGQSDGPAYEQGARLPGEPWRRPTSDELASLVATEVPRNMAASIAIVRLPGEFSNATRDAIRTDTPEALETNLIHPLLTVCELHEPIHCIGLSRNPANLKTVTFNNSTRRYNGLHVDSWEQLGVDSLHLATNRVCINVGESDRFFLFLPFPLTAIATFLTQEMGPGWEMPGRLTALGRQFMERFPEIPVVRCRLAPGEAYIAPTENLVHDGSSAGQSGDDEQFTIRGHITPL